MACVVRFLLSTLGEAGTDRQNLAPMHGNGFQVVAKRAIIDGKPTLLSLRASGAPSGACPYDRPGITHPTPLPPQPRRCGGDRRGRRGAGGGGCALAAAQALNERVWQETAPLRKPLDDLGLTAPVQQAVQTAAERVNATLARLEALGQATVADGEATAVAQLSGPIDAVVAYLAQSPAIAVLVEAQLERLLPRLATHPAIEALVAAQVNTILGKLAQDPAVQALIQAQADAYIAYLRAHPEVLADLIREQGDTYIDYLNLHPDAVENLVQGQSVTLAGEVLDEVRERTVTIDSAFEMVLRTLLRRPPRDQLPPPTPQVQRRAEFGRLPSDFAPEAPAHE